MDSLKKNAVVVGLIFVVATVAALLGASADGILSGPGVLEGIAANRDLVLFCVVMYVLAALTSVGIAVALYPVLKERNPAFAMGAVVFRAIEAVFYLIAVLGLLSLAALAGASPGEPADKQAAVPFLLKLREHATLLGVVSFCIGSFLYYWIFFRSRLVPLWLSIWGMAGGVLMLVGCGLSLYSGQPITGYTYLVLPIALQEMVLAVWLIVKGFRVVSLRVENSKAS